MIITAGLRFGGWRVVHLLGEGSFSRVFSCVHDDGRRAAAKVLRSECTEEARARLEREARLLERLDHPAIPHLYGIEELAGHLVVLVEQVEGTPCDQVLRGVQPEDARVVSVIHQVAEALAHAHAHGIAHRDIKPEHVLVDGSGGVHLLDFGAALVADATRLTGTAGAPFTALYAPPEWFDGAIPSPEATDAYALGQLGWELAVGRRAFQPAALDALGEAKGAAGPLNPGADHPRHLREVLQGLTTPIVSERWTVARAAEALAPLRVGGQAHDQTADLGSALEQDDQGMGPASHWTLSLPPQDATWEDGLPPPASTEDTAWDGELPRPRLPPVQRIGRYEVVRELGRGGMGIVFEAIDPELDRRVAVKLLPSGRFARGDQVERFLSEARSVARLAHPDIVPVLDIGHTELGPFFTMPFVDGQTLSERLEHHGRPSIRAAVELTATIARALHHAHELGIVHRDIKPGNIMLEDGTRPRLVDFGLALGIEGDSGSGGLTREGRIMGTPRYIAPEQARADRDALGRQIDVYSLGVVLYELLTGRVPFDGDAPLDIIRRVIDGAYEGPRQRNPEVDEGLARVCEKAMALVPEDRYDTALAFAEDLERCLTGEPVHAVRPSWWRRVQWWLRRHRVAVVAATTAIVVLVVLGAVLSAANEALRLRAEAAREAEAEAAWAVARERATALWADGEHDAAEELLDAFVRAPELRGTGVVARAWRERAERLRSVGDDEGARRAWAFSLRRARSFEQQSDALVGLARTFHQGGDLPALAASLQALEEVDPGRAEVPEVAELRRDLALALRQWEPTPDAPQVLQALARARPTGASAEAAVVADLDGDDRAEVYVYGRDGETLVGLDGAPSWALPDAGPVLRVMRVGGEGPDELLMVNQAGTRRLVAVGGTLRTAERWTGVDARDAETVDLGSGPSVYLADGQRLLRLGREGLSDAHPDTRASRSAITALASADLDGDGAGELVVGTGPRAAYDVRVLTGSPDGDAPDMVGRAKLGWVQALDILATASGPRLLVLLGEGPIGGPQNFPLDAAVPEAGLHLVSFGGAGLGIETSLGRGAEGALSGVWSADLDGDGLDEILGQAADGAVVRRQEGPSWLRTVISRTRVLAVHDVDADGDDELLVRDEEDGAVWWLGTGEQALPPIVLTSPARQSPPQGLPETASEAWRRSERLAQLGLFDVASVTLRESGVLVEDPRLQAAFMRRAAQMAEAMGDAFGAADLYARAWEMSADGVEDVLAASEVLATAGMRADELDLLTSVLARPEAEPGVRLELTARRNALGVLERAPDLREGFDQPLDARWRIDDLVGLRRDPTRAALRVESLAPSDLLALPVSWGDGPLVLEASFEDVALEAGAVLELVVTGGERRAWGIQLTGTEGGERPGLEVAGVQGGERGPILRPDAGPWTLRYSLWPTEGLAVLELMQDGAVDHATGTVQLEALPTSLEGASLDLALRVRGGARLLARAALSSLVLRGATPSSDVGQPAPGDRSAAWWLVEGDAQAALRVAREPADRFLAYVAGGDDGAAADILATAPSRPMARLVAHVLHVLPNRWAPRVRELYGERSIEMLHEAWGGRLGEPGDPDRDAVLLQHTGDVVGLEPEAGSDAERRVLELLAARARAALTAGRVALAQSALDRVETLVRRRPHMERTDAFAQAMLHRARLSLANRELGEAAACIADGLDAAPSRSVFADGVLSSEELQVLANEPVWERVRAAAAGR